MDLSEVFKAKGELGAALSCQLRALELADELDVLHDGLDCAQISGDLGRRDEHVVEGEAETLLVRREGLVTKGMTGRKLSFASGEGE